MTDDRIKELAATLRNPARYQVEELLRKAVDEALAARPEEKPTAMPLIKRLKDQRDECAALLRDVRTVMQSVHGSGAAGKDIDVKTRDWLKKVDAALEKCPTSEQQLRNIAEGIGMPYEELLSAFSPQKE